MRASLTLPLAGVLCAGLLLTLAAVPSCRVGCSPGVPGDLLREAEWSEQLDEREAAQHKRREAKMRVAGEVIAGKVTLKEAAERFQELDLESTEILPTSRGPEALKMSEEEWHARNVIYFCRLVLGDRPDAAQVLERLGKELSAGKEAEP
jgi:hypothetical protein